jgi:hypothetical protein
MKIAVFALLASLVGAEVLNNDPEASSEEYYNILTIDGGGIRGLISAMSFKEMERYSWDYALKKGYEIPFYDSSW